MVWSLEVREHVAVSDELLAYLVAEAVKHIEVRVSQPQYFTSKEAAEYLRCSVGRIHNLVNEKRLPPRKEGARLLFTRDDLDGLVQQADQS